jgi:HEAT repeat protein
MSFNDIWDHLHAPILATRVRALEELIHMPVAPEEHAQRNQLVIEALRDSEPLVRANATDAALELNVVEAVPCLVALLAGDDNAMVRASAAEALGELGVPDIAPTLAAALHDPDAAVRTFAANSLGLLQATDTVPALLAALNAEPSPPVRLNILFAITRLGSKVAPQEIHDLVLASANGDCGLQALNAIQDFLQRPKRSDLSAFATTLIEALSRARSAFAAEDVSLVDELASKLSTAAPRPDKHQL